jgi:hypothetical protein
MDIVSKSRSQRNGYMRMLNQHVHIECLRYWQDNKHPTLLNNTETATGIKYENYGHMPSKGLF